MTKFETRIINWIEEHLQLLFFVVVTLISAFMRYLGRELITGDMENCLIPWFEVIGERGGLFGLYKQVGDYGLLYQTVIAIMTYIPINCIYQYKFISSVFDFLLAYAIGIIVAGNGKKGFLSKRFVVAYTTVLMMPTVIFNGAFWGQCDSVYAFFSVMSLYLFQQEKYKKSMVFLGISLGLKLQTVFLFPFFVIAYFYKKRFSIFNFIIAIVVFLSTGIVGYINGRSLWEPIHIYLKQYSEYKYMYCGAVSFWKFADHVLLYPFSKVFTMLLLGGIMFFTLACKNIKKDEDLFLLKILVLTNWTCVFFFPAIHERYTYLLELLLLILATKEIKNIRYFIISLMLSLCGYVAYLYGGGQSGITFFKAGLYLFAYVCFAMDIVKMVYQDKKVISNDSKDSVNE